MCGQLQRAAAIGAPCEPRRIGGAEQSARWRLPLLRCGGSRYRTTLFMPVADVSLALISLILSLVDGEGGRYVRGQGGGMNIIDDRCGGRPAPSPG